MKTLTLSTLSALLVLSLFASSAFAIDGIDDSNHAALTKYYENLAKDAKAKLQENKAALDEYEAHPYYYGRQGQDFQSHTSANIHEYEEILAESLNNADLHRKVVMEQGNPVINKAKVNLDGDSSAVR